MIEEHEGERDATLAIDGDETPVAYTRDDSDLRPVRELVEAVTRRHHAVLEARAVLGEGVVPLRVIARKTGEIRVPNLNELFTRMALIDGNGFAKDRVGRPRRFDAVTRGRGGRARARAGTGATASAAELMYRVEPICRISSVLNPAWLRIGAALLRRRA
jgi:hypothetical protein